MKHFSQSGIETHLSDLFTSPGFFVEIGCWDGLLLSQTVWLEREKGWRGVCVDPFPKNFKSRTCRWKQAALSADGKPRRFVSVTVDRGNGGNVSYLSGFEDTLGAHRDFIFQNCDYEIVTVPTVTYEDLRAEMGIPAYVDFLSIDTEGSEVEILESIDLSFHKFTLICIEHNQDEEKRRQIGRILAPFGYELYGSLMIDDLYICSHKQWLDHEYDLWIEALKESTVRDFKDHPMVRRMLGDVPRGIYPPVDSVMVEAIDRIGYRNPEAVSGNAERLTHYARMILEQNPPSIVEIGGGCGELYAILRALGYQGKYFIYDLLEVKEFQDNYLREVEAQTGLHVEQSLRFDFCVSLYALGEFDDESKLRYVRNVIQRCAHGLVVWNPHSRATKEIPFPCRVEDETPTLREGNKLLTW